MGSLFRHTEQVGYVYEPKSRLGLLHEGILLAM